MRNYNGSEAGESVVGKRRQRAWLDVVTSHIGGGENKEKDGRPAVGCGGDDHHYHEAGPRPRPNGRVFWSSLTGGGGGDAKYNREPGKRFYNNFFLVFHRRCGIGSTKN